MKKTLALVLSVAMVFGLMAFPASADFEDSSDIQYTEAVDVMTACGVINGFEDGSFDPTGTLTREQAAKVIAYLMLGGDTADALVATTAPFDDVAATRWSAGYIAYCVSSGIVSGRDGKTFDPTGSVTGYEFAKMLLVALGYDASVEVYTGSSWAVNVAKTALDIDLFDGNDGANYNTAMTREEAALYAFNTLQATLVDYDSTGTSIDLGNGIIVNTGATKAEDVEDSNDSKDTIDSDGYLQFAEKYFTDLERDDDDKDDFGRPATTWTYDDDDVGTYAAAADLTYTAKVKCSAIYSDTNDEAKTADYIVDGETQTDLMLHDISGTYYNDDAADKIGGNGTLIEVYYGDNYDEDDGGVLVVEINTYVGYISDWNEATDDYDEYVTIDAYSDDVPGDLAAANDDIDDDSTFVTAAFDDDDADDETVVLFTCALNDDDTYDIESVVPADSVTAFVTRSSTDKFVAGGTTYKYSANYDVDNVAAYDSNADDAVIYLDTYGYAIYVDSDATSSDDYAYVADTGSDSDIWDTDNNATYYAKLVLESGEVVTVETDEYYNGLKGQVVSYDYDSDDVYTLYEEDQVNVTPSAFEVNGGSSKITVATNKDDNYIYADSNTVFVLADTNDEDDADDYDYTVYVGYKNVPDIDDAANVVASLDEDTNRATYVYVENSTSTNSAESVVYLVLDASELDNVISEEDVDDYIELDAVIDGEKGTAKIKDGSAADNALNTVFSGAGDGDFAVYASASYNSDGLITKLTALSSGDDVYTGTRTEKIEDDVVYCDGAYYAVADDCVVFKVDDDGDLNNSSLNAVKDDADMGITVVLDDDDAVSIIILNDGGSLCD